MLFTYDLVTNNVWKIIQKHCERKKTYWQSSLAVVACRRIPINIMPNAKTRLRHRCVFAHWNSCKHKLVSYINIYMIHIWTYIYAHTILYIGMYLAHRHIYTYIYLFSTKACVYVNTYTYMYIACMYVLQYLAQRHMYIHTYDTGIGMFIYSK